MRLLTLFVLASTPLYTTASDRPVQTVSVSGGEELGLKATDLTPELRTWLGGKSDRGVLVGEVREGSAAAAAGLRVGDIITVLGGEKIEGVSELFASAARNAGATVPLRIVRDKREQSMTLALPASTHYSQSVTIRSGSSISIDSDAFDSIFRELSGSLSETPFLESGALDSELSKLFEQLDPDKLRRDFEALERALRGQK